MKVTHVKTLRFMPKAWMQQWLITEGCPIEISAMGLLVPGTDDIVQEFFVPKQVCTGTSTIMDNTALLELNRELLAQGADLAQLCVFMHSHVNMLASPSGTDEDTMDRLANGRFLWSIITNKTGAHEALAGRNPGPGLFIRLDTYDPTKHDKINSVFRMSIENCPHQVLQANPVGKEWLADSLKEVTQEVPQINVLPAPTEMGGTRAWQYFAGGAQVSALSDDFRGERITTHTKGYQLPVGTRVRVTTGPARGTTWTKTGPDAWEDTEKKYKTQSGIAMIGDLIVYVPTDTVSTRVLPPRKTAFLDEKTKDTGNGLFSPMMPADCIEDADDTENALGTSITPDTPDMMTLQKERTNLWNT